MADNAQSVLRRLRELKNNPRGVLEQLVDQLNNRAMGRVAEIRPSGAGMRQLSREERTRQMTQDVLDNLGAGGMGALGVIKSKGGNWLTGSVENALKGLKRPELSPAQVQELVDEAMYWGDPDRALAEQTSARAAPTLNKWIEGPLTRYVKRDMATEGDPVRKLAEQGILHFEPPMQSMYNREVLEGVRGRTGNLPKGVASSDLAKSWENASDLSIDPTAASLYRGNPTARVMQENQWLSKLAPEDLVYEPRTNFDRELGFSHLTDELANALNPESGLPRNLLLTPEDFQQMGMERAVRHVHNINEWRAAQKSAADLQRANNAATVLFKEYAENNPRGLRWVELRAPENASIEKKAMLTEGDMDEIRRAAENEAWDMKDAGDKRDIEDIYEEIYNRLTNETTGSYLADYNQALADALKYEGETMGHCVGGYCPDVLEGKSRIFSLRDAKGEPHVTIETGRGTLDLPPSEAEDLPDRIVQIKGKQNRAPNPEYLPFVQDFVKSGKWSEVGDLHNAGLYRHHVAKYPDSVADLGEYATKEEIENWVANHAKPEFASGGLVQRGTTWRPMELDGIIGYITE